MKREKKTRNLLSKEVPLISMTTGYFPFLPCTENVFYECVYASPVVKCEKETPLRPSTEPAEREKNSYEE